jgi:hypothetical protein
MEYVDASFLGDLLSLGTGGFVAGVIFPIAFRALGYVFDAVRKIVKG